MGEDTRYCGNCKREVSAKNFTVHSVHCQRNIAVCSLCSEPVPRSHYQQHVESNHKSVQCPKCQAHLEPLQLFAHEKEECPKRLVKCQHCELEVTASEFQRHMDYCESRTELCKGCTKYVQYKHLQFHYEHDHKYLTPDEKDQENSSDEEGSECPICLGPVTLPLELECGHVFCMVCVKGIANTTKNCAICRRDIPRDMLMDIRFCREEDIIKNYVNKPRQKKTQRSHSVPSRTSSSSSSRRVARTTQDYDDMVSALLASRTSSTSYRYQRPANTHTPPSYTPYSSDSCKDSGKDTDSKDDDCCCSSMKSASSSSSSTSSTATSTTTTSSSTARTSSTSTTSSVSSVSKPPPASSVTTTSSTESSRSTSVSSSTSRTTSASTRSVVTSSSSTSSTTTSSSESSSSSTTSTTSYSSYSNGARPRRPTFLALETTSVMASVTAAISSSSSRSSASRDTAPPTNATQEQYDRWLAFQLAKAEDDLPPSEFNKKHRPTFRRSLSMPERAQDSSSDSSDSEDSDSPTSRRSSRRPPASPRNVTSSPNSSSSASSSSRSTPISKSSSDSNASSSGANSNSSSSALSTGARPKNVGLKKRVSFKEDAPAIRREAPVMLPCEFCDEMFAERDLMRHQTSCEQNETQLPRASRIAQRAAAAAAAAAAALSSTSTTTTSGITTTSASSSSMETSVVQSSSVQTRSQTTASSSPRRSPAPTPPPSGRTPTPVCTPRKTTASTKSPAPVPPRSQSSASTRRSPTPASPGPSRSYTSGWRSTRESSHSSPVSTPTSPPPSCPPSISPPPVSPPPTTTITIVDQKPSVVVSPSMTAGSNRPFSVSPAPSGSTSSSSVSSGSMSSSSVSTTPSTSSSASPVPATNATPELAPPDTPTTDLEYDYEDEDGPFMRPRRGRLLSSAIFSWRSISGGRKGYVRSNTAPLEDTGADEDTTQVQQVITSRSATQLPAHRPSPEMETTASPQPVSSPDPIITETKQISTSPQPTQEHAETVFIKNPNKYRAPPPPQTPPNLHNIPNMNQKVSPVPTTNVNGYIKSPTPWEKAFNRATSPPPVTPVIQEKTLANGYVNGIIKFDSKTMMNGHMTKEIEELIPCEFCKQVFSPDKFRSHQTMCEAANQPPTLRSTTSPEQSSANKGRHSAPPRHNKGPAPSPPESLNKESNDTHNDGYDAYHARRLERAQSVKDDRTSYSEGMRVSRRLERASSIKESRTFYGDSPSLSRRWGSREVLHSNSMESSASLASGGWTGSTSNLFSSYISGHSWNQHINSVRSDVRARTANCSSSSGQYYGTRYRERSSSRPRPASMYTSSGTWGSMFDLSSPTRSFNISDAFSSASLASKRRYIR